VMVGVATLRKQTVLMEEIRDYETAGNWSDALRCYEQALQSAPNEPSLHVGLLRCLRNLGHWRSAIAHVRGTLKEYPEYDSMLSAAGVEAAWRLCSWDVLEEFIDIHANSASSLSSSSSLSSTSNLHLNIPYTSTSTQVLRLSTPSSSSSTSSNSSNVFPTVWNSSEVQQDPYLLYFASDVSNPNAVSLNNMVNTEESSFEVGLGRILLSLQRNNDALFDEYLSSTRIQVMRSLAAASRESYRRSYQFFVQQHMLRDIEHFKTTMKQANGQSRLLESWNFRSKYLDSSLQTSEPVLSLRRVLLSMVCFYLSLILFYLFLLIRKKLYLFARHSYYYCYFFFFFFGNFDRSTHMKSMGRSGCN